MTGEYPVDLQRGAGGIEIRSRLYVGILVIARWIRGHPGIIPMFNAGDGKNDAGFEMGVD